ncbi:ABC transporter transmembrane domain-containing protein [Actinomadura xylanilytica]|uniref:ABC transporter transmembrane domain-containing protein n=1 Tax=Actinomadura xylanilytica TaxID=887459 RepID=UPI00255AB94D|nr:ABC transporter ATP-binding protein [Actinomadura xylanilytica]MDL4772182.1 ABC transporter ATP-binding protein [Actinomadura xylanilytica]
MKPLPVEDPGTPDQRTPARYLLWLARVQRRGVAWGGLLGVVWMLSQALMPAAVGRAIDQGVAAKDTRALLAWTGAMVALGVVQALSGVARHRVAVFNWLSAAYRTVQVVTRQSTRLGASLHRRLSAGEVVSVGISDVAHIGDALDILARGAGSVVAVVVVAIILLAASPPLGLIVLVGVPLILLAAAPLLRPLREREHRHRELIGELNTHATDLVAGLRVLRGVGGEKLFAGRYRAESQRVRRAGVDVARAESMLSGAEILLPGLLVALVTWVGARFTADGTLSVGQLVAFYGYAVFLIQPLKTFGEAAGKFTKAHVSAARVVRMLAMDPELPGTGTARPDGPAELVDVASGLVVRPGVFTAVAAAEPRDAQAIADRLGRYADGEVTYGGVPLADVAGIRERILVAVNEDRLFSGTLRDSLATGTGTQASGDDLLGRALRTASAEDIVAASGLDGHVAEAGREFSGGQRQRLRLARALAADHEVLVLIEPTSAVDAHTEARIAGRLGPARAGRTTVVCTTSPLVLDRADHVVFVERGRVVAEGAHRDLLDTEPRYAATVTREEAAARP